MTLADVIKNEEFGGKEKHLPSIELEKGKEKGTADKVTVIVGKEVAHPNTIEHHIAYLEIYGVKTDGQVVSLARADFGPSYTNPRIVIETSLTDMKTVYALSYCNIHGLWQSETMV